MTSRLDAKYSHLIVIMNRRTKKCVSKILQTIKTPEWFVHPTGRTRTPNQEYYVEIPFKTGPSGVVHMIIAV